MRQLVCSVMPCDGLLVSTFSPEDGWIRCSHAWVEGQTVDPSKFPPVRINPDGEGMQSRVILTGEPLMVDDVDDYTRAPGTRYYYVDPDGTVHDQPTEDAHSRSAMMLPISLEGRVLGVVQVMSNRGHAFDARQLRIILALTAQMSAAHRNALLFQQAQTELARGRAAEAALRASEQRYRELVATLEQRVEERTAAWRASHDQMVDLYYTISHDLRAPIRAIRGFLDALLDDLGIHLSEEGRSYAARIIEATKRMDLLIKDLLSYSRVAQLDLDLESVPIVEAVREAAAMERTTFEEGGVQIRFDLDPAACVISHRATLVHVIWNLVENAAKFVPPSRLPAITVRSESRDGRVRLWVEDNGIGIAPEHHERVFNVFERLDQRSAPGTGIGLAVVKKAVERMGGAVGLESTIGAGSRFWIELREAPAS